MTEQQDLPLLADFTASVRRPRPVAGGLQAELFACNGRDADEVMRLGLSAHQDATVDVDLRDEDGQVLGGFIGELRRPDPKQSGMVARFLGRDGDSADAITALSLSRFLDATVRVQVRLMKLPDGSAAKKEGPKGPYSAQASVLWKSQFLAHTDVWTALGTDDEFRAWLSAQPCCAGAELGTHEGDVVPAHVRRVADGAGTAIKPPYSAIPLCNKHHQLQHQHGESAFGGKGWSDRMRVRHLRTWCWSQLRDVASAESMAAADPTVIRAWADRAGVSRFLPEGYR